MKNWLLASALLFFSWQVQAVVQPQADVGGYTAQYDQPFLNSGDTCTSDTITFGPEEGNSRTCHSPPGGADNPTCDATIVSTDTEASIESDVATTTDGNSDGDIVICVSKGTYTTAQIDIDRDCSATVPCWFIYKRSGDTDDDPWNMAAGDQAIFADLEVGGDYWRFHRISFEGSGVSARLFQFLEESNFNVTNRILAENSGASKIVGYRGDDWVLQNSVVRNTEKAPGADRHCVSTSSDTHRGFLVNNELYDCAGDSFQTNAAADCQDCVLENNDLYQTTAMYCDSDGTPNVNGDFSAGEEALDLKRLGNAAATPMIITQNRIWGIRSTDNSCGSTGSAGEGIVIHDSVNTTYGLIQNNIIIDSARGITIPNIDPSFVSVVGNILYHIDPPNTQNTFAFQSGKGDNFEFYLNTVIDVPPGPSTEAWFDHGGSNHDIRCNVIIDAETHAGTLGTNSEADYQVFYGVSGTKLETNVIDKTLNLRTNSTFYGVGTIVRLSIDPFNDCAGANDTDCFLYAVVEAGTSAANPPAYCGRLNCVVKDGTMWVKSIRGPYVGRRKLRTVAAGELFYIAYARLAPITDAPDYQFCPSSIEANACGSRTSIGIDNQACEDLAPTDIRGVSR